MISFGSMSQRSGNWTWFKPLISAKNLVVQYEEDNETYTVFGYDIPEVLICVIWKGTLPDSIISGGYSQAQNDADKSDFETNYKPYANRAIDDVGVFNDPRIIRRFGNLTATSTSEMLVATRPYNGQASEAQRSIKSTSAVDSDTLATGARTVRITYLDSNYVLKTEDVNTNGILAVATVATDIRFIEKFEVVKGVAAVGAVELWSTTLGTGTAICGIAAATTEAFLCHHYVPAGKKAWIMNWGTTVDDEANMKLNGQARVDGTNLVDRILDLEKLSGIATPPGRLDFTRPLDAILLPEKTYCRITVAPLQSTSTVIRSRMIIWEDVL